MSRGDDIVTAIAEAKAAINKLIGLLRPDSADLETKTNIELLEETLESLDSLY
jgi:hypothetical protein